MAIITKVDANELGALKAQADARMAQAKTDNNEGLILAEALTYVESQLVKPLRPLFFARDLMSVDSSGSPWQDHFKYYELRGTHDDPKWVDSLGDGSIPSVNANLREVMGPVKGFALSATWTQDEINKIQAANANRRAGEPAIGLEQELVEEVARGMADFENNVLLYGDAARGIKGFLNNDSYAAAYPVPANGGGNTSWDNKTPLEILEDLHEITWRQYIATRQVEAPNKMVLSNTSLKLISTTPMSADNPRTILEQFLATNRFINSQSQVMSIFNLERNELATLPQVFQDGGLGFCYNDSSLVLKAKIPLQMQRVATFLPDQSNPFGFRAIWLERIGGVSVRRPQAILRFTGHEA